MGPGVCTQRRRRVRVASLPESTDNPYYRLFYGALRRAGVEHIGDARYEMSWFRENRQRVDWVHFHWVQSYYSGRSLRGTIKRGVELVCFLVRLRALGLSIAWTCHNLYPHETRSRAVDYVVRMSLAHLSRVVIVHSEHARHAVRRHFGRFKRVIVVRHGHFSDCYHSSLSKSEARDQLGLPQDAFVYLSFGILRPYKGIETLIEAFRSVPDRNALLLIAGKPMSAEYGEELRRRAAADRRIRLVLGHVPDEALPAYFRGADLGVMGVRSALTSGSLLLCFSMGLPVVMPQIPSLLEYVDPRAAYVVAPGEGLTAALTAARARCAAGEFRQGSDLRSWVRGFDWDAAVAPLAEMLLGERS